MIKVFEFFIIKKIIILYFFSFNTRKNIMQIDYQSAQISETMSIKEYYSLTIK